MIINCGLKTSVLTCVWVCIGGGGGAPLDFELFLLKKQEIHINTHCAVFKNIFYKESCI